jgi:general secretion pathway protein A
MYESFYGFKEKPFNLTPDPDYLFLSQVHDNAYTHLEYAITENKGFVVVTGEIGSGKTTLINFLLRHLPPDTVVGVVNQTDVLPTQFLRLICRKFELDADGKDKADLLSAFHGFLLKQEAGGNRVILIIDEAQNLPLKTIEELRMLSNLESEKHHFLQIVMAGQPEFSALLRREALEQFTQRVTVYCHLEALDEESVRGYIRHRLHVAGASNQEIFDERAVKAVYEHSRGIPRMVNSICDTALVYGYADKIRLIDEGIVHEAARSRKVGRSPSGGNGNPKRSASSDAVQGRDNARLEERLDAVEKEIAVLGTRVSRISRDLGTLANKNRRLTQKTRKVLALLAAHAKETRQVLLKQRKAVEQITNNQAEKDSPTKGRARESLLRRVRQHSS